MSIIDSLTFIINDSIYFIIIILAGFILYEQRRDRMRGQSMSFGFTIFTLLTFIKILNFLNGIQLYFENGGSWKPSVIWKGPGRHDESINIHKEGLLENIQ